MHCCWQDSVLDVLRHPADFCDFQAIVVPKEAELYQVECEADGGFSMKFTLRLDENSSANRATSSSVSDFCSLMNVRISL